MPSRRQRHLNPKAAGAKVALDSRFITGLTDGSAVTTWTDRTGSYNATQSNASYKPTYKTGIVAGCPVVRFGGTNKYLATGNIGSVQQHSVIVVCVRTGSDSSSGNTYKSTFVYSIGTAGSSTARASQIAWYEPTPNVYFEAYAHDSSNYVDLTRNDNWNIHSALFPRGAGNLDYRINGGSGGTGDISSLVSVSNCIVAVGSANYTTAPYQYAMVGDMAQFILFNSTLSASVRKRFENCAAFTFKISCS